MPGMMYVPRQENPWERMIPQLLSQLALMKIEQNLALKQAELKEKRKYKTKRLEMGDKPITPTEGMDLTAPDIYQGPWGQYFKRGKPEVFKDKSSGLTFVRMGDKFEVVPEKKPGVIWSEPKQSKDLGWIQKSSTGKVEILKKQGWSNPYFDKKTNQSVQKNLATGEIRSVGKISPPSSSERQDLAENIAQYGALVNLEQLFNEAYVGPVAGRVGKVRDLFGWNPQKQSEFNAATAALKNYIIKLITGARMSEKEAERIMKQIPDVVNPPSVWKARMKQTKKNVERLLRAQKGVIEGAGLNVPETVDKTLSSMQSATPKTAEELKRKLGIK
jgi:hypothetical protein